MSEITSVEGALKFISDAFEAQTNNAAETTFTNDFQVLVNTAQSLHKLKLRGELPKNSEINKQLKIVINKTEAYKRSLKDLNKKTKLLVDREYIRTNPWHGRKDTWFGYLMAQLDRNLEYCQGSLLASKREASVFRQLEYELAKAYQNAGRKITIYSDGEFGQILRAYHLVCNIDNYPKAFDDVYIKTIVDGAELYFENLEKAGKE